MIYKSMSVPRDTIPIDTLFIISELESGSDYTIHGLYRPRIDVVPRELVSQYFLEYPDRQQELGFNMEQFTQWMFDKDMLEPVPYMELFCEGTHGDLSISKGTQIGLQG